MSVSAFAVSNAVTGLSWSKFRIAGGSGTEARLSTAVGQFPRHAVLETALSYRRGRRRTRREWPSAETAAPSRRAALQFRQIEPSKSACPAVSRPSMRSRMTEGDHLPQSQGARESRGPALRRHGSGVGLLPKYPHLPPGCESLVQQKCDHATRSIPRLSSSTVAAA